ncbi:outer membrane beta-barrel protein [Methylocapsa sp. D3K7]|uniref:outer membrane protein n=1 Tax=Methylocapsa sp. D3K7 TaxID=3041435 RepID=UPI00244EA25E|nr:outer membrane beta-barrel protein [Methylocapsa sp. D3K7]WGJ14146.1 outer membrane beta-barrel protein [Methylocapsa sp. D3K7]
MRRQLFLASAGALALTGAAFAADLPIAPPPPPPVFTWTGIYIGGYGGGEITHTSYNTLVGAPLSPFSHLTPVDIAGVDAAGSQTLSRGGFTMGGELGYNWQIGWLVLGVETDIGGVTGSTHSNSLGLINGTNSRPGVFFPFALTQRADNGLYGTTRGRLGVAFDRVLVYGTGGVAYTSGHSIFTYTDGLFPAGGTSTTANKVGYVVGGGIEYALNNNVSVKGEFLYTQYGKVTTSGLIVNSFNPAFTNTYVSSARVQEYTARVGINYRFNWFNQAPVVAKY